MAIKPCQKGHGMEMFAVNIYIVTTVRGPRRGAAAGMLLVE